MRKILSVEKLLAALKDKGYKEVNGTWRAGDGTRSDLFLPNVIHWMWADCGMDVTKSDWQWADWMLEEEEIIRPRCGKHVLGIEENQNEEGILTTVFCKGCEFSMAATLAEPHMRFLVSSLTAEDCKIPNKGA